MNVEATAIINSFTYFYEGEPLHYFGDSINPSFEYTTTESENAKGLGDLTLRFKYSFQQKSDLHIAALFDARLSTGNNFDFLGSGENNFRLIGIFSRKINDFTAHINAGYEFRPAKDDSDEIEFAAGFDQKIIPGLSFAFDILGEIDINKSDFLGIFSEQVYVSDRVDTYTGAKLPPRKFNRSNIPSQNQ